MTSRSRRRRPAIPFEAADQSSTAAISEAPPDAFLFEVSWEVGNQVGGIYQVLRSKAPLMTDRWGERYCLIGPWVQSKAQLEVELVPATGFLASVVEAVERAGVKAHHGRWLVQGKPHVLLLEEASLTGLLAESKFLLWEQHGIESPGGDAVIDRAVLFGEAVQRVLAAACMVSAKTTRATPSSTPRRIVAHLHEWQGALALPAIRRARMPVATIFTTHATQLGRYIASSEDNFYERLSNIDHAEAARRYRVGTQHSIERACAHGAHVLTTVSEITAEECVQLLGRKPEVITPNGLTISRYNVGHDFQTFHADFKDRIHQFTSGYFFPSHTFDLDRTLYFFTSGRFEPRNKGFDLCLESMARLNSELKQAQLGITVVFFIVTSRPTLSINPLMLEKRGVLNELRDVCAKIVENVGEEIFFRAAKGERLHLDDLVEEYWQLRYRRTQAAFRMNVLPPVVTHILDDDQRDPLLNQIRALGLFNRPEDAVKIVYHPEFIGPANPLWGIEYEQFVRGCHLGLFPSAYEPWGYTPLECMALGTPAVSSDLAGFGGYVERTHPDHDQWGLSVLPRRGKSFHDSAAELTRILLRYCQLSRRERVTIRNEVERRSWDFDWARLGDKYHEAHDLALARLAAQEDAAR